MFDTSTTIHWIRALSKTGRIFTCVVTAILLYVINSLLSSDKNQALTMTLGEAIFVTIWLYEAALSGKRPDHS